MSKVISLKRLNLKRRKRMYTRPKRNLDINPQERKNNFYKIFLSVITTFSVLIGAFAYLKFPSLVPENNVNNIINILQNGSFAEVIKILILSEFVFFICCFFMGINLFGNIAVTLIPVLKAFFSGYAGAYIYNHYELNGVLFSLIFLVPYLSATCTLLIAVTNESYLMSKSLSESILHRKTTKDGTLRLFSVRFILIMLADLLIILPETLLLTSFGGKISLQ